MGKINQGILGGFSGKVGSVIGSYWKGISFMRSKAVSTKKSQTLLQLKQRAKFSLALSTLQPITAFARIGFNQYAHGQTAFNAAMSYNFRHAITGDYPNYKADYQNLLVARGTLTGVNATLPVASSGKIKFSWTDNSSMGEAQPTDKVMVVAINPAKREAAFITEGAPRAAKSELLAVSPFWTGDEVHTYLAFISEDGREVATSIYCGAVTVV